MAGGGPFAIAGLWEHWQGEDGEVIESCALLTTEANDLMRPIHDRMPVIVKREDFGRWLDPQAKDGKAIAALLCPCPADRMTSYPVSTVVNNPRNENPACAERLAL